LNSKSNKKKLKYLKGLEVAELQEEDMLMI